MFFLAKKIISALILPPTSLVLLACYGLWLARRRPKTGSSVVLFSLTSILVLSLPIVGNSLIQSLETIPPISATELEQTEAIVVLGGGKNDLAPEFSSPDTVNRHTLERLRYAAYLQHQIDKPILVTGGAPFDDRAEALSMAETLSRDFRCTDIWIEDQSKDTAENAIYSGLILKKHGIKRIALISQAWHLPRATPLFEAQGLTVYPAPTGYSFEHTEPINQWLPKASALDRSAIALKEYLGRFAGKLGN